LKRKLRADLTPDIYHLHGTWLRAMYYAAAEAERRGRPYLIELMGMYEPYGLSEKQYAKQVARKWFQDRILRSASCLHVNSAQEATNLRRLGFTCAIAVIPVGVDMHAISANRNSPSTSTDDWITSHSPYVLFLSRLHPKKGLALLLQAWATANTSGCKLLIAGVGDPDYVNACQSQAVDLGISKACVWLGHVDEKQKSDLFRNASFYVLPSYSDNFANSVVEALAHERPVLTTTATPWRELREQQCGWIAEPNADSLRQCLDEALACTPGIRREMGIRGGELARQKYSLDSTIKSLDDVYLWVKNGGVVPKCVEPATTSVVRQSVDKLGRRATRVLITTTAVSRLAGGLFESVRYLAQNLENLGTRVDVLSFSDDYSTQDVVAWSPIEPKLFSPILPKLMRYSAQFAATMANSTAEVLHTHGIWQYPSYAARNWKRLGRAHVMSPRGMLEPWALQYRAWKKLPVWWLRERKNLLSATAVHTTSRQEAQHVRRLGFDGPIAVIPNGVTLPSLDSLPQRRGEERTVLFLSRIHPKKGLTNLIHAWREARPPGWKLVVCGIDEGGYINEVLKLVRRFKLEASFTYVPGAYGSEKDRLFASADLFILPSFSENFGIVVAEALSWGMPVITTKGTPWAELETCKCGWWIEPGAKSLTASICEATSLTDAQRGAMGVRGRALVEENYTWARAATDMKRFYDWILAGGPTPEFVFDL
jgi:glycosyltransferase involved in cell wall biosynthesis